MMHLSMDQLLAVRDGDRSEPELADAHEHVAACVACRDELDRLHQRTARIRALPRMSTSRDHFPEIRTRWLWELRQRRLRMISGIGIAAAAALLIAVVGHDLVQPPLLDAAEQLETSISRSQQLEATLQAWNPEERVVDSRTARLTVVLEDRIAEIDMKLQETSRLEYEARVREQLELWRQRVGLMDALVDIHVTKASNVDL